MAITWQEYQEEAASFFRSIGLEASTDVTVDGVRTSHDIDVLVTSQHVGFEITWIIECKHWKTRVSKLHVLALREIVSDLGADRGILLCETGFQSGAIEASNLTNVQVTSLAEISDTARDDIYSFRLRELYDIVEECNDRYWEISKNDRIEFGLRSEVGAMGYSGAHTIEVCRDLLSRAFRNLYPFASEALAAKLNPEIPDQVNNVEEVISLVEPLVNELVARLDTYDKA